MRCSYRLLAQTNTMCLISFFADRGSQLLVGFLLAASLICFSSSTQAQNLWGSVGGQITDAHQAPIVKTMVTLTHVETNRTRSMISEPRGRVFFSLLPPGSYRMTVEHDGFRKHVALFDLRVNQRVYIQIELQPGSPDEEVVVIADQAELQRDSAAMGAVIENHQITGLPLDGRNFYELSLLLPGSSPAAPGSAGSVRGDLALNVSGAREDANSFLLDGVYNIDPKLNTFGTNPPVDAIQEFEVLTHSYDASFGRSAGGQINVVLKSGTNDVHGSAYGFFRNAALDARNFFVPAGEPDPEYRRNQFGGSVGGPLIKDRTFFFADYEGRRVRQGVTRTTTVPTQLERSGDFSQSRLAPRDPASGQPLPGAQIPAFFIHPVGSALADLYPLPNREGSAQNFVSSPTLRDREDHFDFRLDHSLTQFSDLTLRYSFGDRDLFEPFSGALFSAVPGYGTDIPRRAQNLMLSETHVFSAAVLNQVRVGFNRVAAGAFQENIGNNINQKVGLPELSQNPRDTGLSFISISGFSPLGDEFNNPQHSVSNLFQIADQLTWVRGDHLFQLGVDFRTLQQNGFRDVQSRGFLNFIDQAFTGNALADLLLGLPAVTGGARLDNHQHLRTRSYNFFFQDQFRLRPDLSISLGLRYEFNSPPVDAEDRANVYDLDQQGLVQVGTNSVPRSGYAADRNNWAPRLGMAWSLDGEDSRVLRAGYGVYFDQSALAPGEGLYFNPPFFDFKLFFSLPGLPLTLADPFPAFFPLSLPSSVLAFQSELRTAYVQHWSLSLQQQLGEAQMLELGYVGSKGTKLLTARDINQPRPSPQEFNLRPDPRFDDINLLESRAGSTYHALQVRFRRMLSSRFSFLGSYTWSKSLDDASSFFTSAGDPNFPQDSFNVQAEKGRSNFDLRHRLSLSYSYEFPVGRGNGFLGSHGWLSSFLADWQTFGILTFQTGRPFTVSLLSEIDNSNTGRSILGFGANDRPHRLSDGRVDHRTPERWFDTSAFNFPDFGSFGDSGRNILEGPGFQSVNLSLVKNAQLDETVKLQFRVESFNLFNRPNFDLPDIFLGSPTFGRILSAQAPRRLQLGVKLLF